MKRFLILLFILGIACPIWGQVPIVHNAVKAATTGDCDIDGAETIDGVVLSNGDRVLVKNGVGGDATKNGVYSVNTSGAWSRHIEENESSELYTYAFFDVREGTVNGGTPYWLTTSNPIVLGTTELVFSEYTNIFAPVKLASTAADYPIVLSGEGATFDGVVLSGGIPNGDRVLVKNYVPGGGASGYNGLYYVRTTWWPRTEDADTLGELTAGMMVRVQEGDINAGTGWILGVYGTGSFYWMPSEYPSLPPPTPSPTPGTTSTPTATRTPTRTNTPPPGSTSTPLPTLTPTPTRTPTPIPPFPIHTLTPVPIPGRYEGYLVFLEDFNQYRHEEKQCWDGPWELWLESPEKTSACEGGDSDNWPFIQRDNYPTYIANDTAWRPGFLTTKTYCEDESAIFMISRSNPDEPDFEEEDWTNITIEVDVNIVPNTTFGIVWSLQPENNAVSPVQTKKPYTANVLLFHPYDPYHPDNPTFAANMQEVGQWNFERGMNMSFYNIPDDVLEGHEFDPDYWTYHYGYPFRVLPTNPSSDFLTYFPSATYVFQLTFYQGRATISYMLRYGPDIGVPTLYYGCSSIKAPTGVCTEVNMSGCWCQAISTPTWQTTVDPGAVGLFISGAENATCQSTTNPQLQQSFDNFKVFSYRPPPNTPTPAPVPTIVG